jgi:hypothetical protein
MNLINTKADMIEYLRQFHNIVNIKLDKPIIDKNYVITHYKNVNLSAVIRQFVKAYSHKYGNYEIKANWREDLGFGFDEIFETTVAYISPIIHQINKMESKVLYYGKQLPMIDRKNSKFSEIGMSIFWTYNLSDVQFKILKGVFDELRKAGIIDLRVSERTEV